MEEDKNSADHKASPIDHSLELLIDKKISDAKLMVTEKRLGFSLTIGAILLTIFGIVVPMLLALQSSIRVDTSIQKMEEKLMQLTDRLSNKVDTSAQRMEDKFVILGDKSSNRIDTSIQRMEERFKEMAGKQLRKPRVDCFVDGNRLSGNLVIFGPQTTYKTIEVRNTGDGTADNVRMILYLNYEDDDLVRDLGNTGWFKSNVKDRPEFVAMFIYEKKSIIIPAKASATADFWMQNPFLRKKDIKVRALLKIFYGEPMPYEVPFSLELRIK